MPNTWLEYGPWEKPIHDRVDLGLPLRHLLGNRILVYPQKWNKIEVNAFWLKKNQHKGRIHVYSSLYGELHLIEDMVLPESPRPEDFPSIIERITKAGLVDLTMYYPISGESWNFRIHLKTDDTPREGTRKDFIAIQEFS